MNEHTPCTFWKYGFLLGVGVRAVWAWDEGGVEQNLERENKRISWIRKYQRFLKFSGSLFASYVIYCDLSDLFR
jgi:hypothetical protein